MGAQAMDQCASQLASSDSYLFKTLGSYATCISLVQGVPEGLEAGWKDIGPVGSVYLTHDDMIDSIDFSRTPRLRGFQKVARASWDDSVEAMARELTQSHCIRVWCLVPQATGFGNKATE